MSAARTQWRDSMPLRDAAAPPTVVAALRLSEYYRHRIPSVDELTRVHGMSQSTAYRWRRAFQVARGEP